MGHDFLVIQYDDINDRAFPCRTVDIGSSPDKYEPVEPKPFTKSESYEFINRSQVQVFSNFISGLEVSAFSIYCIWEAAKKVIFLDLKWPETNSENKKFSTKFLD